MKVTEAVRASLRLLSKRDRRLLGVSVAIQMSTSVLDLIGVMLLGLVGALSVAVVQSQPTPALVQSAADTLGLESMSGQDLVVVFAVSAAAVLLSKSVISSYLTRRVLTFLANRQAVVAARLTRALLAQPLTFLMKRSSQQTAYALIQGVGLATIHVLGQSVIAVTELSLLLLLSFALMFLDPVVTLSAVAFFAVVGLGLQMTMGGWASRVGKQGAKADIQSLNAIQEALTAYREVSVTHRRGYYVQRIQQLRWEAAKVAADRSFIGLVPKYAFEAALVVGGFALAGGLFLTQDAITAVGTLALFLAAASRVMPSLLRLQTAMLSLRNSAAAAGPTFALADDLDNYMHTQAEKEEMLINMNHADERAGDLVPAIHLEHVSFSYPDAHHPAIYDVSVSVGAGQSLAVTGSSGAGKSTLADLILGVLQPDSGIVTIGGIPPQQAIQEFPGGVAYVPQEVMLANGSIRENVALGLPPEAIDDDLVWQALQRSHLDVFLSEQREGIDTQIGEAGLRLSGGQRQRLGIARALYSRPKLVLFDEATSALDAESENFITQTLRELEGDVTTVIVAHRLSTVRHVDCFVYLQNGRIAGVGTFEQVRQQVPELRRQASLLGL